MDLVLTSEQVLLRDIAAKFATSGAKLARASRDHDLSYAPDRMRQAAEMGWLSILVPEEAGGLGLGLIDQLLVLEEIGRGLVCEPIAAAAVSAYALSRQDQRDRPFQVLADLIAGDALVVPALQETGLGMITGLPATVIERHGSDLFVTGRKEFVFPEGISGFILGANGPEGIALCYVDSADAGCKLESKRTIEGRGIATLRFERARAHTICQGPGAVHAYHAVENLALMASSAELLGIMEKAQDITLEYLRTRKQFGKLIGSFQALQHKAADNFIRIETTRSLLFQAAASIDLNLDSALASAVKAQTSGAAMFVTKSCIQLHGAIGFTDEHDIGLYHKRAIVLSSLLGDELESRRRFERFEP